MPPHLIFSTSPTYSPNKSCLIGAMPYIDINWVGGDAVCCRVGLRGGGLVTSEQAATTRVIIDQLMETSVIWGLLEYEAKLTNETFN